LKKDSKILVTGGTGFVGKNLLMYMNNRYDNVLAPTRKECNLYDEDSVNIYFSNHTGIEYVFHCAAKVGGIQANMNDPYKFLLENLQIQNNVINNCIRYHVKKVLNLGSSCIYPKDYKQPLKEEYLLQAPVEPTNEGYAIAKIAGLKLCEYANKQQDHTKFISLMPCNLYGWGDNFCTKTGHVLAALIHKIFRADVKTGVTIWGTGEPRREFMHVADLVDGMLWAMNNLEKTDTFLNIGTGQDHTIDELAYSVMNAMDNIVPLHHDKSKPNGMMKKCLDVSKINRLGWKHQYTLEEGLKMTLKDMNYRNY
jgi:GDP-L-fucose synthase